MLDSAASGRIFDLAMRSRRWTSRLLVLPALAMSLASGSSGGPPGPTPEDLAFKSAHLAELGPYGPTVRESQREIWKRMLQLAADFDDEEIVDRIFDLMGETDGVTATQYGLDLHRLLQLDPLFLVRSADRYFEGDFGLLLRIWINESFDVTIDDLNEATRPVRGDPLVARFLDEARRMDAELWGVDP